MRENLLRELLAVQSVTGREERMVDFLTQHCLREGCAVATDKYNNVYVTKGKSSVYPAVAAHIDTVQPIREGVRIVYTLDQSGARETLIGFHRNAAGREYQVGVGADCKTGIFVCLELLRIFPVLKIAFMASEESGCVGAYESDPEWFKDVGYLIEFDCPSKNLMSYTSAGVRLFDNGGDFIKAALPTLQDYGVKWQRHPYTDVCVLREKHGMSCLNLASGYYRWHADTEYVYLPDVKNAIEMATRLIPALGCVRYEFKESAAKPLAPVNSLRVTEPICLHTARQRPF